MRIAFVLPAPPRVPQGGALVVARHAQNLAGRGHDVSILSPKSGRGLGGVVRSLAVTARDCAHGVHDVQLAVRGVHIEEVRSLGTETLEMFDVVIATGHQTAKAVAEHVQRQGQGQGQGFYFIQGDERALGRGAEETWSLGLTRLAVSDWVARLVESHGYPVAGVVPNAVDPKDWGVDQPIQSRTDRVVALYHRHSVKGPETLIDALADLRRQRPTVRADVIAARRPSHQLPSWVTVHVRPSHRALRALYNRAAVCLHTSRAEGWGLVPMEAAACGCAVVATASRGPREYLTDGRSMDEVPVGDAQALARTTALLLRHPELRIARARTARADVSRFRWADSTDVMERILTGAAR